MGSSPKTLFVSLAAIPPLTTAKYLVATGRGFLQRRTSEPRSTHESRVHLTDGRYAGVVIPHAFRPGAGSAARGQAGQRANREGHRRQGDDEGAGGGIQVHVPARRREGDSRRHADATAYGPDELGGI